MRVATSTAYSQAINSMNSQNYALNKTMLQISTGKRIIVPSDDPAAAARVLGLNQAIERTDQFQDNITALISALEVEETSLDSVVNRLQRIRELAIQGNNDTYDENQRAVISLEIQESLEAITAFANMTNGGGDFLFGGFDNRHMPFETDGSGAVSYTGDQGQQFLQVGATRQIASGDNGYELFMNVNNTDDGGGNPVTQQASMSIFALVGELEFALRNNEGIQGGVSETLGGTENFHETVLRSIGNLDKAIAHIVDAEAAIGSRINSAQSQESVNADYLVQLKSTLSTTQDLDYAEAISRLELEQVGLQAAQQSFTKIQGLSLFNFL